MSIFNDLKKQVSNFNNDVIKPTLNNFIAIGSFIYLVVQLIAIFFDVKIAAPVEYRSMTMLIAVSLIGISLLYYWIESKFRSPYIEIQKKLDLIRNKLPDIKNPAKNVEKNQNLTYPDVDFAIYFLTKKIDEKNFFDKDIHGRNDKIKNVIIGIDRGGAIIGGMLAKNLGLSIATLAIAYADDPLTRGGAKTPIYAGCLDNIKFDSVTKILLVDDAIRIGTTMLEAKKKIEQIINSNNRQIVLNIACILYQQHTHPLIKEKEVSFCAYKTELPDIWFPWDLYERELLEKDKKNQFEELCR